MAVGSMECPRCNRWVATTEIWVGSVRRWRVAAVGASGLVGSLVLLALLAQPWDHRNPPIVNIVGAVTSILSTVTLIVGLAGYGLLDVRF